LERVVQVFQQILVVWEPLVELHILITLVLSEVSVVGVD
jgi:hypothetical protein